jgi:hypothetical protein
MLRCVHEVKALQKSVAERLEMLERRQEGEEAYLSSLQELQEAIQSQSEILQQNVKECMAQLRQVLDEREYYLLARVNEIQAEKLQVIDRQRTQCTAVLDSMRAASRQTRQAISAEDVTIWLDHGPEMERTLTEQNAIKEEYGPSPDVRFGCTLTADLQRRILEVIDFDERKGGGSPARTHDADGPSFSALAYRASPPPGAGGYGAPAGTPTGLFGSGAGAGGAGGRGLGGLQQGLAGLALPDGTDYAAFRRTLLAGAAPGHYRDPPVLSGRDPPRPAYDAGGGARTRATAGL